MNELPTIVPYDPDEAPSGKRRGRIADGWNLAVIVISLLAVLPVGALLWKATGDTSGIWQHLLQNVLPQSAGVTAILLVGVGISVFLTGSITAWLVNRYDFPLRGFVRWGLVLPLAIPTYLAAYTYTEFLDFTGPVQTLVRAAGGFQSARDYWFPDIRSTTGAILLLGVVLFPYVYLPASLSFGMQGRSMIDVARVLGAGPFKLFWRVAVPAARPAITVGVMLAMMETLNDIGAVEHLGVRTLTFSVFDTWLNRSSLAGAAQISLMLLLVVALLVHVERRMRRERAFSDSRHKPEMEAPIRLRGIRAYVASAICLAPIIFGFVIPAGQMIAFVQTDPGQILQSGLGQAAWHSVMVAASTALVCVITGFVIVYGRRRSPGSLFTIAGRFTGFGYAVPGTILAIGVLTACSGFDNSLDSFMRNSFGISTGLLISGSIAVLVYASSIRFLAIAAGNIEAGYEKISHNLAAAARTLGRTEMKVLKEIDLPLLKRAFGTAALIVTVDTMKELSATLMLRPFNFNTLATYVYERASRAVFEEAAFAALLIVLIGLVPVYMLTRFSDSGLVQKKR